MSLEHKVVMITGAAGNLGTALGGVCTAAGARTVLLDATLQRLQRGYPQAGDAQLLVQADLSDGAAVEAAVATAIQRFGRIDALCNIAGGFRMGPAVHETDAQLMAEMMGVNALTMLNTVRAVVPRMLAGSGGRIVNIGALAGQRGAPNMGAYSASKSVVIRLTESLSAELREKGINVNCVLPGTLDTPQNRAAMPDADPRRWVALEDLARVIAFLCSDAARAIHGVSLPVTGLG